VVEGARIMNSRFPGHDDSLVPFSKVTSLTP
jgi:hypothetical protein